MTIGIPILFSPDSKKVLLRSDSLHIETLIRYDTFTIFDLEKDSVTLMITLGSPLDFLGTPTPYRALR